MCIGCGACTTQCKFDAITLHKEYNYPPITTEERAPLIMAERSSAERIRWRLQKESEEMRYAWIGNSLQYGKNRNKNCRRKIILTMLPRFISKSVRSRASSLSFGRSISLCSRTISMHWKGRAEISGHSCKRVVWWPQCNLWSLR